MTILNLLKYASISLSYFVRHDHKSKVVYYHDVGFDYTKDGTPARLIKKHISILKRCGYVFVPKITEADNQLMVCFDDGWKGLYDNRELFLHEGIYPTIFIAVDLIGKDGYMTEQQLKELVELGFNLQSHTYSHQDLAVMDEKELTHELTDSRIVLQRMFDLPFDEICFPMGRFSALAYNESIKAGYKLMYTSLEGGYFDGKDKRLTYRYFLQSMPSYMVKYYVSCFPKLLYKRAFRQHYVNA